MRNFIGHDGFIWWVGVVEDVEDPLRLGRCKVRCFGYHPPKSANQVLTSDLPWATTIHPINTPNLYATPKVGDWLFGFFLDSLSAQEPAIIGYFPSIPLNINDPNAYKSLFSVVPERKRNFDKANTASAKSFKTIQDDVRWEFDKFSFIANNHYISILENDATLGLEQQITISKIPQYVSGILKSYSNNITIASLNGTIKIDDVEKSVKIRGGLDKINEKEFSLVIDRAENKMTLGDEDKRFIKFESGNIIFKHNDGAEITLNKDIKLDATGQFNVQIDGKIIIDTLQHIEVTTNKFTMTGTDFEFNSDNFTVNGGSVDIIASEATISSESSLSLIDENWNTNLNYIMQKIHLLSEAVDSLGLAVNEIVGAINGAPQATAQTPGGGTVTVITDIASVSPVIISIDV